MEKGIQQECVLDGEPLVRYNSPGTDSVVSKSLSYSNGLPSRQSIWASGENVRFTQFPRSTISHRLPNGSEISDACTLLLKNGEAAVVLAINGRNDVIWDETELTLVRGPCVALYALHPSNQFTRVRSISVKEEITCVKVLLSETEMSRQRDFLHGGIRDWPHLIAIGCRRGSAFIGRFPEFYPESSENWTHSVMEAKSDILKTYRKNNIFNFEGTRYKIDDITVTSMAFCHRWRSIVLGTSAGFLTLVHLDSSDSDGWTPFVHVNTARVHEIAILESENDPRNIVFIWAAHQPDQADEKPVGLIYRAERAENHVDDSGETTFRHAVNIEAQMDLPRGARWISVHSISQPRRANGQIKDESTSSLGDPSRDELERTLAFFAYYNRERKCIEGGVYDLEQYYYKRMLVRDITFDKLTRQNETASLFRLSDQDKIPLEQVLSVNCFSTSRFSSPLFSDDDALFAPMSLQLGIRVFGSCSVYEGVVQPLQSEVLSRVCRHQPDAFHAPAVAVQLLRSCGLYDKQARNTKIDPDICLLLRAISSMPENRRAFLRFISSQLANRRTRLVIAKWMKNEVYDTIAKLDEHLASLFVDGLSLQQLAPAVHKLVLFAPHFFRFAEDVFDALRKKGEQEMDDTPQLRSTLHIKTQLAHAMRVYVNCLLWLRSRMPPDERSHREMSRAIRERILAARSSAEAQGKQMYLDELVSRLQESIDEEDDMWEGVLVPAEWFPPALYNLVSVLRKTSVDIRDRAAILFYYLLEFDVVVTKITDASSSQASRASAFEWSDNAHSIGLSRELASRVRLGWAHDCDFLKPCQEMGASERTSESNGTASRGEDSTLNEQEKNEIRRLINFPFISLPPQQEKRLQDLLLRMRYGEYRWNIYLIRKCRYHEVADLPVPPAGESGKELHEAVRTYANLKSTALERKKELLANPRPFSLSQPVMSHYGRASQDNQTENSQQKLETCLFKNVTIVRGKTPKKAVINVRRATENMDIRRPDSSCSNEGNAERESRHLRRIEAIAKHAKLDENNAPDEAARAREALRTPRAKSRLAARLSGRILPVGQASSPPLDTTPENKKDQPMPTSILKSGKKDVMSTVKPKLRFAAEFQTKSISPRPCYDSSRLLRQRLNFDVDPEGSEGDSVTINSDGSACSSVMEQESSAAISDGDAIPSVQHTFTVYQSNESSSEQVENEETAEQVEGQQGREGAEEDDGITRSFEEQEEYSEHPEEELATNFEDKSSLEREDENGEGVQKEGEEHENADSGGEEETTDERKELEEQVVVESEQETEGEEQGEQDLPERLLEEQQDIPAQTPEADLPIGDEGEREKTMEGNEVVVLSEEDAEEHEVLLPQQEDPVEVTFIVPQGIAPRRNDVHVPVIDDGLERSFEEQDEKDGEAYEPINQKEGEESQGREEKERAQGGVESRASTEEEKNATEEKEAEKPDLAAKATLYSDVSLREDAEEEEVQRPAEEQTANTSSVAAVAPASARKRRLVFDAQEADGEGPTASRPSEQAEKDERPPLALENTMTELKSDLPTAEMSASTKKRGRRAASEQPKSPSRSSSRIRQKSEAQKELAEESQADSSEVVRVSTRPRLRSESAVSSSLTTLPSFCSDAWKEMQENIKKGQQMLSKSRSSRSRKKDITQKTAAKSTSQFKSILEEVEEGEATTEVASTETNETLPVVKRGRGRPRKSDARPIELPNEPSSSSQPLPTPGKRGSSRTVSEASEATNSENSDTRTRKTSRKSLAVEDAPTADSDVVEVPATPSCKRTKKRTTSETEGTRDIPPLTPSRVTRSMSRAASTEPRTPAKKPASTSARLH